MPGTRPEKYQAATIIQETPQPSDYLNKIPPPIYKRKE